MIWVKQDWYAAIAITVSRGVHMLTHEQIEKTVEKAATKFPLT